jgi:hypothetical protein
MGSFGGAPLPEGDGSVVGTEDIVTMTAMPSDRCSSFRLSERQKCTNIPHSQNYRRKSHSFICMEWTVSL